MNNKDRVVFYGILGLMCYAVTMIGLLLNIQINIEIFFGVSAIIMTMMSCTFSLHGEKEC